MSVDIQMDATCGKVPPLRSFQTTINTFGEDFMCLQMIPIWNCELFSFAYIEFSRKLFFTYLILELTCQSWNAQIEKLKLKNAKETKIQINIGKMSLKILTHPLSKDVVQHGYLTPVHISLLRNQKYWNPILLCSRRRHNSPHRRGIQSWKKLITKHKPFFSQKKLAQKMRKFSHFKFAAK